MFDSKSDDNLIDEDDTLQAKVINKVRNAPPYLIYGGLMGLFVIFLMTMYVLWKTFNYHVYIIVLFAILVTIFAYLKTENWKTTGIIGFSVFFVLSMIVAYYHIKHFATIDATLHPSAGSPVDERWNVEQVQTWLSMNDLQNHQAVFRAHNVDGRVFLGLNKNSLSLHPFFVSDPRALGTFTSAIQKGLYIHHDRKMYHGRTETLSVDLPVVKKDPLESNDYSQAHIQRPKSTANTPIERPIYFGSSNPVPKLRQSEMNKP